jgi:hypothetical protein
VLFPAWETFYVIVGSSAGALTGLMFVAIALVADFGGSEAQIEAFGTPTVVHFGATLLLSLIVAAPWPVMLGARSALIAFGAAGTVYTLIVSQRAYRQTDYKPVVQDWLFHSVLPFVAYVSVLVAGLGLPRQRSLLLFTIGASAVLLLFIGIHNAWDTVTYIVVARWERRRARHEKQRTDEDVRQG